MNIYTLAKALSSQTDRDKRKDKFGKGTLATDWIRKKTTRKTGKILFREDSAGKFNSI
jgi:hypothetical protein